MLGDLIGVGAGSFDELDSGLDQSNHKKLNDVSGGGFPGARYNEKKIADGVATLMAMENVSEALRHNVETLHRFGLDASAEVERYMKENSKTFAHSLSLRLS